jgi:hypothetical protein
MVKKVVENFKIRGKNIYELRNFKKINFLKASTKKLKILLCNPSGCAAVASTSGVTFIINV